MTGVLNEPSKQALENEFGTKDDDEVIRKILEGGEVQTSEVGMNACRVLGFIPRCLAPPAVKMWLLMGGCV